MALAKYVKQREVDKFVADGSGDTAVRTLPTGGATAAGQASLLTELEAKTEPANTQKTEEQSRVTTPTVYNVTLTFADTEYSQALPASTKEFRFRCTRCR